MRIIKIKLKQNPTSVQEVAANNDLLTEILLRLPVKSLIRFKCVSKHWLSLITNPYFSGLRTHYPKPAIGLFLHCSSFLKNSPHKYIHFDMKNPVKAPFNTLTFVRDPFGIRILQSCNGLLLCCSFRANEPKRQYYVYNPTTKQFTTLPKPGRGTGSSRIIHAVILAFDPSKSPHYKVVCIRGSELALEHYQFEIYSSESGPWRISGQPFTAHYEISFKNGIYWNGAIHWLCGRDESLYFNVVEEKLKKLTMPPAPPDGWEETRFGYFGESCDHLNLVEIYSLQATLFNVYELKSDHSGWFLKYRVDLDAMVGAFPELIRSWLPPTDFHHYAIFLLAIVRGEKEEDSFMVLHTPGKAIRYNLLDGTFNKLCDFVPEGTTIEPYLEFHWLNGFQYIESLSCV